MKTTTVKISIMMTVVLLMSITDLSGQVESLKDYEEKLDLKLQLIDSRLELYETKLKLLDATPDELSKKFEEVNAIFLEQIDSVYDHIHSLLSQHFADSIEKMRIAEEKASAPITDHHKSAIKLSINRIFEGSLLLSYEYAIKDNLSIDAGLLATYVTKNSIGDSYFGRQTFQFLDAATGKYDYYTGQMITGLGGILQVRNYLLPHLGKNYSAPLGLYASPFLMYRNVKISGMSYETISEDNIWITQEKEITQKLHIGSAGVILGYSFSVFESLAFDIFVGSVLRLSKYEDEKKLTKYKSWNNIDYSGILPTAGISISILK